MLPLRWQIVLKFVVMADFWLMLTNVTTETLSVVMVVLIFAQFKVDLLALIRMPACLRAPAPATTDIQSLRVICLEILHRIPWVLLSISHRFRHQTLCPRFKTRRVNYLSIFTALILLQARWHWISTFCKKLLCLLLDCHFRLSIKQLLFLFRSQITYSLGLFQTFSFQCLTFKSTLFGSSSDCCG